MNKQIILLVIGLVLQGCFNKFHEKNEFILRGEVAGLSDGTVIYLIETESSKILDSVTISNQKFELGGELTEIPFSTYIYCKDPQDARKIWMEPGTMTLKVDSTLIDAELSGSETDRISFELYKQVKSKTREEKVKILQNFVRYNPESILSASLLSGYSRSWGKNLSQSFFDAFSEDNKQTKYGKQITRYLKVNNRPNLGDQYVDIKMSDQFGRNQELSDLKGKVILLEFWASWCKPCREQNPELLNIYNENHADGFDIFAVALDSDKDRWLTAIEIDKLPWTHVSDLDGDNNKAAQIYGVSSVPDNFLIDRNGIVIGRDLRGGQLSAKLKEILVD